jgi:hypothetical protein
MVMNIHLHAEWQGRQLTCWASRIQFIKDKDQYIQHINRSLFATYCSFLCYLIYYIVIFQSSPVLHTPYTHPCSFSSYYDAAANHRNAHLGKYATCLPAALQLQSMSNNYMFIIFCLFDFHRQGLRRAVILAGRPDRGRRCATGIQEHWRSCVM